MNLPRVILTVDSQRVEALVARTDEDRALGLMHRQALGPDEGMLFVHDAPIEACFWMKDTPIDLSIAFVGDDGTILNIEDRTAQSLESACAPAPVRFVLEMAMGWFAGKGIAAGARLAGLPAPA